MPLECDPFEQVLDFAIDRLSHRVLPAHRCFSVHPAFAHGVAVVRSISGHPISAHVLVIAKAMNETVESRVLAVGHYSRYDDFIGGDFAVLIQAASLACAQVSCYGAMVQRILYDDSFLSVDAGSGAVSSAAPMKANANALGGTFADIPGGSRRP